MLGDAAVRRLIALTIVVLSLIAVAPAVPHAVSSNITALWMNDGTDKVTRDDLRVSRDAKDVTNSVWDGTTLRLFGARNETINFVAVLEALNGAADVSVSLSTLTGPKGATIGSVPATGDQVFNFVDRNIELFYVRYLQIKGLSLVSYDHSYDERHVPARFRRPWSGEGFGTGTWQDRPDHDKFYPEIAVPLELVPTFSIPVASNQSIWTDIYIPKTALAGLYQGELAVSEGGTVTHVVPVQLQVHEFTLPDTPSAKTMVYFSSSNINYRHLGIKWPTPDSAEGQLGRLIRDRYVQLAHRHGMSLVGDDQSDCYPPPPDQPCPEWLPRLDGTLFTASKGYAGRGVNIGNNVYSVGTYGSWGWKDEGQSAMHAHTDAWMTWFNQNAPTTEVFLYLIDESSDTNQIETWAQWILNNPGPGYQLRSMATIPLPTAAGSTPSLDIPTSTRGMGMSSVWQPLVDQYTSDARKRFYMYNSFRPQSGTTATEDDGVALRELAWVQWKKKINRWFKWESTYYDNFQFAMGDTNVFQSAQTFGKKEGFHAVKGESGSHYSNGDGVLFYPGTERIFPSDSYGVNGPFASLRLKFWRRGLQDVDYLALAAAVDPVTVEAIVENMVPKALWEYGVSDPNDPTWVRTDIGWSVNPNVWETARKQLADIIVGGSGGTVVSMTAPSNGATVFGVIALSASAFDPVGIAGVTFLVDGVVIGSEITTSPYQISYDTTLLSNGNHSFAARARNTLNVTSTSAAVVVNVDNGSSFPGQFSLVSPLVLSPASPAANQATTATFTVQNKSQQPASVSYFFVGARDPLNGNVDFPASSSVTLQPRQQYTYKAARSFTTAGTHSAWPAYYDGVQWIELAPHVSFTVQQPSPGKITLTTPLTLSPASPGVNQVTKATFTVQNTGGQPVSVPYFFVGARDPFNGHVDFPTSGAVTLQPGQTYTYQALRSFATVGTYSAWPAFFDGSDWIELAAHTSFTVKQR